MMTGPTNLMMNTAMLTDITNALQMQPHALPNEDASARSRMPMSKKELERFMLVDAAMATMVTRTASHKTMQEEV
jgi:hypothetical protein